MTLCSMDVQPLIMKNKSMHMGVIVMEFQASNSQVGPCHLRQWALLIALQKCTALVAPEPKVLQLCLN